MNKINLNKISNWLFYLGIIVGGLGYYQVYRVKSTLPPGVCPIDDNRWIMFLGVALLLGSVTTSFIADRMKKNN